MYEKHELEVTLYERNVFVVASDDGTLGGGGTSGGELPDLGDDE